MSMDFHRAARQYMYYGELGSPAWNAGGMGVLEEEERRREEKRRKDGLVDVFDFEHGEGTKYGCGNYVSPLAQVHAQLEERYGKPIDEIKVIEDGGTYEVSDSPEAVLKDWGLLKKITVSGRGKVRAIEFWPKAEK